MSRNQYEYSRLRPLWISVFVDILGFTLILPYLYFFAEKFTTNAFIIGLLLSSNAIFGIIFGPILGKLSDKYGRKPLLLISQAGTFIAFIMLAFSNSLELMFAARIVDGIFGGQFPIAKAVIGDVVPPKERSKQMTNIGIAFTLAALIGPGMGGLLSRFGIIGTGLAASGIALFTLVFTAITYRETLPKITGIEEPWHTLSETAGSGKIRNNSKALHILTLYAFIALIAQMFQGSFSIFGAKFIGLVETDIGILFTAMGVFQVIFRGLFFERIRKRAGDVKTSVIGLGMYIISYSLLIVVSEFWQLLVVLLMISLSGAMSRGIILGFASRVVDHRNQGKINGLTSSLDSFSQILGPLIGSAVLTLPSPTLFGILLAAIAVVPFIMGFRLFNYGFEGSNKITRKNEKNNQSKVHTPVIVE